jgi:hypothetical protein
MFGWLGGNIIPGRPYRPAKRFKHHGLGITRAVFLQGRSPNAYIPALDISLFLSADESGVRRAVESGHPAGQVLESKFIDDPADDELRIAFDFDGVLANDESEKVFRKDKLEGFQAHEVAKGSQPLDPGLLKPFLQKLAHIQRRELEEQKKTGYKPRIRTSIVTARNAPAHERVIHTMRAWDVLVNEAFFLGGIEKNSVLNVLKPHIFFDDQKAHLVPSAERLACVVHADSTGKDKKSKSTIAEFKTKRLPSKEEFGDLEEREVRRWCIYAEQLQQDIMAKKPGASPSRVTEIYKRVKAYVGSMDLKRDHESNRVKNGEDLYTSGMKGANAPRANYTFCKTRAEVQYLSAIESMLDSRDRKDVEAAKQAKEKAKDDKDKKDKPDQTTTK